MTTTKLFSRRELAESLGVHMQTITKWEREGMPVAELGRKGRPSKYSVADVRAWLKAREQAARSGNIVDLTRERARKERAQALVAEQTIAIRAGRLLRVEDVAETWTAEITAVRAKLLAWSSTLPDRMQRASELEGVRGIEKEVTAAVEELLLELSAPKTQTQTRPKPKELELQEGLEQKEDLGEARGKMRAPKRSRQAHPDPPATIPDVAATIGQIRRPRGLPRAK